MKQALPVHTLGAHAFPGVDPTLAERAASTLIALASTARLKPDDAGLLPCRVHAFFRGLPGIWVCRSSRTVRVNSIRKKPSP